MLKGFRKAFDEPGRFWCKVILLHGIVGEVEKNCFNDLAIGSFEDYYGSYSFDYLYAINPNGTLRWKFQIGKDIWKHVNSLPAIGSDGTIYIGSGDNNLYAIYPNGTLKWKFEINDNIMSPVIGSDGTIYVGSNDNFLYAIGKPNLDNNNWYMIAITISIIAIIITITIILYKLKKKSKY